MRPRGMSRPRYWWRTVTVVLAVPLLVVPAALVSPHAMAAAGSYADAVMADNPVSYWRLADSPGSGIKDERSKNSKATIVGSVIQHQQPAVAGGSSIRIVANQGHIDIPNSASLAINGPVTLEAWINLASNQEYQSMVEKYDVEHYKGYGLRTIGQIPFGFVMDADNWTHTAGSKAVTLGHWHHIAMTADGKLVKVYLDGVLQGSESANRLPTPGSLSLKIGANGDRGWDAFDGFVAEVAVYDRALSADRIQAHFAARGIADADCALGPATIPEQRDVGGPKPPNTCEPSPGAAAPVTCPENTPIDDSFHYEWALSSGVPPPFHCNYLNWDVRGEVSATEGLVLTDVKLGTRYMARRMSIPYMKLATSKVPESRFTLQPQSTGPFRSRLSSLRIQAHRHDEAGTSSLEVFASYKVDQLPGGSTGSLVVNQTYDFHDEFFEGDHDQIACEPAAQTFFLEHGGLLYCAHWRPMVSYSFTPGAGERLTSINVAQRLHFLPDGEPVAAAALLTDCDADQQQNDAGDPCAHPPVPFGDSLPGVAAHHDSWHIGFSTVVNVIERGVRAHYDNLHLTRLESVESPLNLRPPGCPECVHIHWAWGRDAGGESFGNGFPLITSNPADGAGRGVAKVDFESSGQNVDVALVAYHPSDVVGDTFRDLLPGLDTTGYGDGQGSLHEMCTDQGTRKPCGVVMWYSSTNTASESSPGLHDEFFAHGGFFSSNYGIPSVPTPIPPSPGPAPVPVEDAP